MYQRLRLIQGDKISPTRSLDLVAASGGGGVYLPWDAPAPAAAAKNILYTPQTRHRDGQRRKASNRENAKFPIMMTLDGQGSMSYMERLRAEVTRFFEQAGLYEEESIGEPIYLEHCWHNNALLAAKPNPRVGQWRRFWRIIDGSIPGWGRGIHSDGLYSGIAIGVVADLECYPWAEGIQQKAYNTSGLPGVDSDLVLSLALDFSLSADGSGVWSIAGWVTDQDDDYTVLMLYQDSNNWSQVRWNNTSNRFEAVCRVSGSSTTYNGSSQSFTNGDDVHIELAQSGTTAAVYVNGAADISVSSIFAPTTGSTLYLGRDQASVHTGYVDDLDAWRVWTSTWSAAEVAALYADELVAKTAGETIGPPTYHKTRAGGGVYENCDDTSRDNYGQIGNVAGDLPAKTIITIAPPTSSPEVEYYLGIMRTLEDYDKTTLYLDFSGTAHGSASGGQYQQNTGTSAEVAATKTADVELLGGKRYTIFVRLNQQVSASIQGYFDMGALHTAIRQYTESVSLDAVSAFRLFKLGDVFAAPIGSADAGAFKIGVVYTAGSSTNFITDYIFILPYPNARIMLANGETSMTVSAGDKIYVEDQTAVLRDATNKQRYLFRYIGPALEMQPHVINTLYLLQGRDGQSNDITKTSTVQVLVTPRWATSGGPVA